MAENFPDILIWIIPHNNHPPLHLNGRFISVFNKLNKERKRKYRLNFTLSTPFPPQLKSGFTEGLGLESIFGVLDQFYDYRPLSLLRPPLTPLRFGKRRELWPTFLKILANSFSFQLTFTVNQWLGR